jgi:ElaB/YqjD/DUF883 family membrane-anchored ribosome-binding protein
MRATFNQNTLKLEGVSMDEKLKDVVADVERSATECCSEMREKAAELCGTVEEYARREPLKALMIAGGLGLVVGVLLSRR